ncbi:hypothetical protein BTVI_70630 [Pitangus sulphuratus]|nr:hypothetical protein BTVI_70630 [Pitangus sulphuratus]
MGLGKKSVLTSMGSFTKRCCWYNPFFRLLEVFTHKENLKRYQQSPLEMCDRNEASPPKGMAVRDPPASPPTLQPGFRTPTCEAEQALIFVQPNLNELSCEETDA